MSIDYGTEWFKVGLIKPGMPLDVALNKDSKRKTQSVVTIRHDERIYGSDAVSLAGRFPHLTYFNLKSILAKPYDDIHAEEYRHRFVNDMQLDDSRNMPSFLHNDTDRLTVEELIAYQFQNAKQQAVNTAGEDVKDVVITVTPFATQHERQAILDAAELAGLNVLTLMHDETAVALNYAINREFTTTPEYHMFYDMGAGSTVASIVSFSNVEVKEGKRTKSSPQLEVKAVGFDRTLGGHEFDVRLQKLLADGFMDQYKGKVSTSVYESHGAMTRLLKEATRVKQILSANTETMASIEGLHEEKDFKMKITRKKLESLCEDLLDRVSGPILAALKESGMTVDDIQSLVLVGGNVRVPSVQRKLIDIVGTQRIAKNVNADEAAVLGAAFHGASLSNQFRLTKDIKIKDITSFPIEVTYDTDSGDTVDTVLFKEFDALNARKTMTFKRLEDFEFKLQYATGEKKSQDILDRIAHVKVSGLTDIIEKYKDDIKQASTPPKVRVVFEMSPSGLLSVPEAYVNIELPDSNKSFTGKDYKVKSFFGSKDEKETAADNGESTEKVTSQGNETNVSDTDSDKNSTTVLESTKEPVLTKVKLQVKYIVDGPQPLSIDQKLTIKKRIRMLDLLDKQRQIREEAKNNLESFVYRTLEFLYDDTVAIVSTEEQQEKLREQLSETSDWLYDEGEHADTKAYSDRLNSLKSLEDPITYRREEYLVRDDTNQKVLKSVQMVQTFIDGIRKTPEDEQYHTEAELEKALSVAKAAEAWNDEKLKLQLALTPVDDPVLTSKEAAIKAKEVDEALMQLLRKKKPKVNKKKDTKDTNQTEKSSSSADDTKNATDKDTKNKEQQEEENSKPDQGHDHDEL
ncbi:heat shock protein 70 family [Halteromyces radiatus]|uniref:heat shock protein 70 family n=1 Tax=Halteromyces radiatus TaxID=101107 RepID=UPI00221F3E42|nr:heat shock protein 70 family [Halteromyces radiatus]KAI8098795.1 heat shock protein 70 family [Halteromyces radiatus]